MKELLAILTVTLFVIGLTHAQEPGFHVESSHNVLFGDSMTSAGIKFMWIPEKAALRAGEVGSVQWDLDSIGQHSVAFGAYNQVTGNMSLSSGFRNTSSGSNSATWGYRNISSGIESATWGDRNRSSGDQSATWGYQNISSGIESATWGDRNRSSGGQSATWGYQNISSGIESATWGDRNKSSGNQSATWGYLNASSGNLSATWGYNNKNQSYAETVIGRYADTVANADAIFWQEDDQLFVIGNGTANDARNNAFTVMKNGKIGIDQSTPLNSLHIKQKDDVDSNKGIRLEEYDASHYWTIYADVVGRLNFTSDGRYKSYIAPDGSYVDVSMLVSDDDIRRAKSSQVVKVLDQLSHLKSLDVISTDKGQSLSWAIDPHELEKVFPSVLRGEDGRKGVAVGQLSMLTVKALQEQQEIIKEQELKINTLESRLQKLEKLIAERF